MTDDQPVVGGRYQLGEVLGRGGMAEVRRGVDLRLGRPVAVKRLSPQLAADPDFQERFRREAHSAASLNHHAIAAVYDSGEESDPQTGVSIPYIVMELVEGSTLRDILRSGRKLLPERALELTKGVCEALEHSHAAGVIHRDIKPANVMLTPDGGIKVMDFGIARAATDTSTSLTKTAAVIGTAQYLSPEQARGESVDLRSDIYSTGCLLYELLVGRPPFVGESSVSVAYQHVRENPVPPSQLDPELSPDVDAITLKALAKDPADRYQSAREMAADISRVLSGAPASAGPLGPPGAAVAAAALAPTDVLPGSAASTGTVPATAVAAGAVVAGAAAAGAGGAGAGAVPTVYEPDPEPEPRRSGGRAVLIAVLAFLLLGSIGYGIFRLVAPSTSGAISVPDVKGATRIEAGRQLRAAKLVPQFTEVEGRRDGTLNTVLSQDPEGGAKVAAGRTVVLELNVGPKNAEIPGGLVGDDLSDVKTKLKKAGFTAVRAQKAQNPPDGADKNEVLNVDPAEGSSVALGQEIVVTYVAKAPAKTTTPATSAPARTTSQQPTTSSDPTRQNNPTSDPTTSKPTKSAKPTVTSEPPTTKPTTNPTTTKPTTTKPTTSVKPTKSVKPTTSVKPTKTAKPAKPAKPTKAPKTPKPVQARATTSLGG